MLLLELAEDRADLAHDELEHVDLLVEDAQYRVLDRAGGDQVEDEHLARLADPVDAADALFDRHRIPRDVEVDQRVAELQVAPLAARLACTAATVHRSRNASTAASFCGPRHARRRTARTRGPADAAVGEMRHANRDGGRTPTSSRPGSARAARAAPPPCRRCRRHGSARAVPPSAHRRDGVRRSGPPPRLPPPATTLPPPAGAAPPCGAAAALRHVARAAPRGRA